MVKINKEDAFRDRKVIMRWVEELVANALENTVDRNEAIDEIFQIDDYVCRVLGLDPNDIPHWLDD
jgi:hypothetical protein